MKKLFILKTLIFFTTNFSFSQNYKEMLNKQIEWQLTVCNNGCITDIYFTDGDTSFNGYDYKILNGYHYISKTFWLRENSISQRVYISFLQNNNRKEVLLYDFDLEVGDSIDINNPISPFVSNPGYYIVDSIINKTLDNGFSHDHFYLSPLSNNINEQAVWIEGIGSLSLINAPGGTPNVNGAGKLSCYFGDGNIIYSQLDSISSCVYSNSSSNVTNLSFGTSSKVKFYTDLFGKLTDLKFNTPIFIHYDDGTVKKYIYLD